MKTEFSGYTWSLFIDTNILKHRFVYFEILDKFNAY